LDKISVEKPWVGNWCGGWQWCCFEHSATWRLVQSYNVETWRRNTIPQTTRNVILQSRMSPISVSKWYMYCGWRTGKLFI